MLTAVALILFLVESLIPSVPLPGVKIGLSCIITTLVLYLFNWKDALTVLAVRIMLGAIICGNLASLPYAAAGGLLSLTGTVLIKPFLTDKQIWIAGVAGAVLHNCGQMAVAVVITGTPGVIIYLPPLILCGIAAGFLTGLCVQFIYPFFRKRFFPVQSEKRGTDNNKPQG